MYRIKVSPTVTSPRFSPPFSPSPKLGTYAPNHHSTTPLWLSGTYRRLPERSWDKSLESSGLERLQLCRSGLIPNSTLVTIGIDGSLSVGKRQSSRSGSAFAQTLHKPTITKTNIGKTAARLYLNLKRAHHQARPDPSQTSSIRQLPRSVPHAPSVAAIYSNTLERG